MDITDTDDQTRLVPPRNDLLFRWVFTDSTRALGSFLHKLLPDLPGEEWTGLTVSEPRALADHPGGKEVVMDVAVTTASGIAVDVEVQLYTHAGLRERMAFNACRLLAGQLGRGQPYHRLRPAITVVIAGFDLVPGDSDYHHQYLLYDRVHDDTFTEVVQLHTIELTKISETDDGTPAWAWLRFVAATTTEELDMAASLDPDIAEAVVTVKRFNADEQARLDLISHEKFMLQQWYIHNVGIEEGREEGRAEGREEGRAEGREEGREEGERRKAVSAARNALDLGLSVDQVAQIIGLAPDEIHQLQREA